MRNYNKLFKYNKQVDEILKIDTEGYKKISTKRGYANYDATPYYVLYRLFKDYEFDENDCLVDFGCGLGRVICFASVMGCRKVIGIEVNEFIFHKLQKNVRQYKVEVINSAAEKVNLNNVNKCFFFNPFYLKYFIKVFNNLMNLSRKKITLFLYDPAKEYIDFLKREPNVRLQEKKKYGSQYGYIYIYIIGN